MGKVVQGNNRFCGPSAISAIAGISTDEAEALIQALRGNTKPVVGAYFDELLRVLRGLGYQTEMIKTNYSLFGFLFNLRQDGLYILMVPHHFVTVEKNGNHRYFCDNHTKEPISAAASARLGQKLIAVARVSK